MATPATSSVLLSAGGDTSWRRKAACREADPELFFPEGLAGPAAADIKAAKAFCRRCLVRMCCLAYAVETGQSAGVWGGQDENERRVVRQRRRTVACTPDTAAGRYR